jgi:uncharacterized protein YdaU (DUF1376 family)
MTPPWMPFYVADYLADTSHLSTVEHGAYLLLIMHYWQSGGLPSDDKKLSRIARLLPREWADIRDTIADLFDSEWRHGRIEDEMAKAEEKMAKRSAAGKAGASARYSKRSGKRKANGRADAVANAVANAYQPQSQSHSLPIQEDDDVGDSVCGGVVS